MSRDPGADRAGWVTHALVLTLGIALLAGCQSNGGAPAAGIPQAKPVPFTAAWLAKYQLPENAIVSLRFNVSREVVLRADLEQLPHGIDGQPIFKGIKVVENGHTFDQITIGIHDPLPSVGDAWGGGSSNYVSVALPQDRESPIQFVPESSDPRAVFVLLVHSDRTITLGTLDYRIQGPDTPVFLAVSTEDLQHLRREQKVMDELLQVH